MIEIDWQRCATTPRQHQKDGVLALLKRPAFMLAHQVGAGKSKIVVDTSQMLFEANLLDTIVVACPAFARGVWSNPNRELGEVAKHGWATVPNAMTEYSVRNSKLAATLGRLNWVVTNYEFIRRDERLTPLLAFLANRRYWLVCDEAWALKDVGTDQWKAVNKIRRMASRITLLNGTPIADNPLDLFAQMRLLDPAILGFKYYGHMRARYAIMKPNVSFPMITGWQNLEELREKCAPYIITKRTRDCFDLPAILDPIMVEAKLDDPNWKRYRGMRDDMVAWLSDPIDDQGNPLKADASIAKQAIVKSMRLAQITSGFLGGVQQIDMSGDLLDYGGGAPIGTEMPMQPQEIGTEKLDALVEWLKHLSPRPDRILVWCRFRLEIERAAKVLAEKDGRLMRLIYGGQSTEDREEAVRLLNPGIPVDEPVGVVGNPLAGGAALNLAGASLAVSLSHDTKLRVYLQARGRIDRPGQVNEIRYVDVVATGPKGQRTIDHHILAALRGKEDVATWTAATWKAKLLEE